MGTREHARLIRKAAKAPVDAIQSVNVPTVMGDEGYAELVEAFSPSRGPDV